MTKPALHAIPPLVFGRGRALILQTRLVPSICAWDRSTVRRFLCHTCVKQYLRGLNVLKGAFCRSCIGG